MLVEAVQEARRLGSLAALSCSIVRAMSGLLAGMDLLPVTRDVDPAGTPTRARARHVVQEAAAGAVRSPGSPSRRQCMPTLIIFGASSPSPYSVEAVAQVLEERGPACE
jgi:hypothetical protein